MRLNSAQVHSTVRACGESAPRGGIEAQSSLGSSLTTSTERWNFVTYRRRSSTGELFACENHFVYARPPFNPLSARARESIGLFNVPAATRWMHSPFRRLNFHCLHSPRPLLWSRKVNESNFNRTSSSYFCETHHRVSKKEKRYRRFYSRLFFFSFSFHFCSTVFLWEWNKGENKCIYRKNSQNNYTIKHLAWRI